MPSLQDVQEQAWRAVNALVPFNPDAGIYKEWLARKAGYSGPLGVPVGDEASVDEGGTAQAFSSGVVIHWTDTGPEAV
jgi:uncharacterized protein with LGFP repeats